MNKFEQELNENMAKAFFVRHGEKLGLAVGICLLGLFIYLGLNMSPDLKDQTPTTLNGAATQAENRIKSGNWEELQDYRKAIEGTVATLDETKVPVNAENFPVDILLARRVVSKPLRTDPQILPPIDPIADVARVTLADTLSANASFRHPMTILEQVDDPTDVSSSSGSTPGQGPSSNRDEKKNTEEVNYRP